MSEDLERRVVGTMVKVVGAGLGTSAETGIGRREEGGGERKEMSRNVEIDVYYAVSSNQPQVMRICALGVFL